MKQTYIVHMYNDSGRQVNFYRFNCKKAATVINQFKKAFAESDFWDRIFNSDGVARVVCCDTPNGVDEDSTIFDYTYSDFRKICS